MDEQLVELWGGPLDGLRFRVDPSHGRKLMLPLPDRREWQALYMLGVTPARLVARRVSRARFVGWRRPVKAG